MLDGAGASGCAPRSSPSSASRDPATDYYRRAVPRVALPPDTAGAGGARRGRALLPQVPGRRARRDRHQRAPDGRRRGRPPRSSPACPAARTPAGGRRAPADRRRRRAAAPAAVASPSMGRFLAVAAGQLVSIVGSALTEFALPIWIYTGPARWPSFALFWSRRRCCRRAGRAAGRRARRPVDRRRIMMLAGDCAAGAIQLVLARPAVDRRTWRRGTSTAGRAAVGRADRSSGSRTPSAVPQLVPKRYLGHANGIVQLSGGIARSSCRCSPSALLAAIGLRGILLLDVVSYAVAIAVAGRRPLPATAGAGGRETLPPRSPHGFALLAGGTAGFRPMLLLLRGAATSSWPPVLMLDLAAGAVVRRPRTPPAGSRWSAALGAIARRRARWRCGAARAAGGCAACCSAPCCSPFARRHRGVRPPLIVIGAGRVRAVVRRCPLVNGVYTTIVQVKVPQRFHGRVFALNQMISWSTLPIGIGRRRPARRPAARAAARRPAARWPAPSAR